MNLEQVIEDSLWSEISICPDYGPLDYWALLHQLNACNTAVQQFMEGKLDEDTFLDTLETNGHQIDDYLSVTDSNLVIFGL